MGMSFTEHPNGFVYILRNRYFQSQLLKIGITHRLPSARVRELSKPTGIPFDFELVFQREFWDPSRAEVLIQKRLDPFRVNPKREFFHIPLRQAIKCIEVVLSDLELERDLDELHKRDLAMFQQMNERVQP